MQVFLDISKERSACIFLDPFTLKIKYWFLDCLTLKMNTPQSFEMSETTWPATHLHIPED
jgi:hypothetical protein